MRYAVLPATGNAKVKEIDWIGQELKGVRVPWDKNLVRFSRLTNLERDPGRLEGDKGALMATIAQAKAGLPKSS